MRTARPGCFASRLGVEAGIPSSSLKVRSASVTAPKAEGERVVLGRRDNSTRWCRSAGLTRRETNQVLITAPRTAPTSGSTLSLVGVTSRCARRFVCGDGRSPRGATSFLPGRGVGRKVCGPAWCPTPRAGRRPGVSRGGHRRADPSPKRCRVWAEPGINRCVPVCMLGRL
jgi:hypothetical protein